MNNKTTIQVIAGIIEEMKKEVERYDDIDYNDITIATDFEQDPVTGMFEWTFQTGDNSYTGSCYGYNHWAVGQVDSETDANELAKDLINQLEELAMYNDLMSQC